MVTAAHLFVMAALLAAQAPAPAAGSTSPQSEAADCSARKLEIPFEVTVKGVARKSKVTLCGQKGQTDSGWERTLEDAIRKVQANAKMPDGVKGQIVAGIEAEIAKLKPAAPVAGLTLPRNIAPLIAPPGPPAEYAALPPLPTAPSTASVKAQPAALPLLAKPRLTVRCYTPGERGSGGPCEVVHRETLLTVRADESLAGRTVFRFLRRGEERGEIMLADLRRGQVQRVRVPARLCAGTVTSEVSLEVLRTGPSGAPQVADRLGPYTLRC